MPLGSEFFEVADGLLRRAHFRAAGVAFRNSLRELAWHKSIPSPVLILVPLQGGTRNHQGIFFSGLVYFFGILIPKRYGDMQGFSIYPILSNSLKYSSLKILYHNEEFLILPKIHYSL
jgi:hypothetical protein